MKRAIIAVVVAMVFSCAFAQAKDKQPRSIELTNKNTVILRGFIDDINVDLVISSIVAKRIMNDEESPIYLLISSEGGEVQEAQSLKRFIESVPNLQVICHYCASAAGFVFVTFKNHNRLVTKKSEVLMHELYSPRFTARMAKDPAEIKSLVDLSEQFNDAIRTILGMSKEAYGKKIEDKNWIVSGKEIVKLKLANEMVTVTCDKFMSEVAPNFCSK